MWSNFISEFINEYFLVQITSYKESDNGYKKASYHSMTYLQCPSIMIYPSKLEPPGVGESNNNNVAFPYIMCKLLSLSPSTYNN